MLVWMDPDTRSQTEAGDSKKNLDETFDDFHGLGPFISKARLRLHDVCGICFETYDEESLPKIKSQFNSKSVVHQRAAIGLIPGCIHTFHFLCIKKWSLQENTCPQCKTEFLEIAMYTYSGENKDYVKVKRRRLSENCNEAPLIMEDSPMQLANLEDRGSEAVPCCMCNSWGEPESYCTCSGCGLSVHFYCLNEDLLEPMDFLCQFCSEPSTSRPTRRVRAKAKQARTTRRNRGEARTRNRRSRTPVAQETAPTRGRTRSSAQRLIMRSDAGEFDTAEYQTDLDFLKMNEEPPARRARRAPEVGPSRASMSIEELLQFSVPRSTSALQPVAEPEISLVEKREPEEEIQASLSNILEALDSLKNVSTSSVQAQAEECDRNHETKRNDRHIGNASAILHKIVSQEMKREEGMERAHSLMSEDDYKRVYKEVNKKVQQVMWMTHQPMMYETDEEEYWNKYRKGIRCSIAYHIRRAVPELREVRLSVAQL
eukprot:GHVP01033690.1.p1 GENE.GHVP01033690.1~~GHVP01033690.1.p1  ORF type:complete len:486 (+),score=76.76 GHVP01033690.1:341-1798(+)